MNQNQVTASLAIVAVSNGTTVNGYVRVDNGPLIRHGQREVTSIRRILKRWRRTNALLSSSYCGM